MSRPVSLVRADAEGNRFLGPYLLTECIGKGGTAILYRARRTGAAGFEKQVVVKTILPELSGDPRFVAIFEEEAKLQAQLFHANIAQVQDFGVMRGTPFLELEVLSGWNAKQLFDRNSTSRARIPVEIALFIATEACRGLAYAHAFVDETGKLRPIIHRDISPNNVMICRDGSVKIIDFGLARTELLPARTQGALAVGKYGYMSPEQARHEKIDGRADLYSVGVMLFEVFTGDRLVDEQDQATLWARVLSPKHRRPSTVVADLPREVDDMIMRAVETRADDRYADARAMLKSVEGFRTKAADKSELIQYLRYLYPTADFSPPPLPDIGSEFEVGEQSMVIAMSEEGAKSVFGRGQLPIEWTKQIRWADVKEELEKKKQRQREDEEPKPSRKKDRSESDLRGWSENTAASEQTVIQHESDVTRDGPTRDRAVDTLDTFGNAGATIRALEPPDDPTTIARAEGSGLPEGVLSDYQQTAYDNKVRVRSPDEDGKKSRLGHAAIRSDFRDDEQTVMMNAPPRSGWAGEDMSKDDVVAETRLSLGPAGPPSPAPSTPSARDAAQNRRAIQERNSYGPPAEAERPAPKPKGPPAVIVRQTAGADPTALIERERERDRNKEQDRTREVTNPPPGGPNYLLVGLFLMGLAIIAVLVILLFKT